MCERTDRVESLRKLATEKFGEGNINIESFMNSPFAMMGGKTPSQAAYASDRGQETAENLLQNNCL